MEDKAGRKDRGASLSEVHSSVSIPYHLGIIKRIFAIAGPAYLVSVGYMDPGNWATDLAAGSQFNTALIWVLLMSNIMAVLLQSFAVKLGIARGLDLAQACRAEYPRPVNLSLYVLCEVAIAACDLAEVLGSAIALNLLFGLPLLWGVIITAADTFALLFLSHLGIRKLEAFILSLVTVIGGSFLIEILLSKPSWGEVAVGFIPSLPGPGALFIAMGMLGATVMPHNLYLHSSLVQTRKIGDDPVQKRQAIKLNIIDSTIALNMAFLVNSAILIMAATVFYKTGHHEVAEIQDAHRLLEPILGAAIAPLAFAIALLASGQSSTITGTLAGQIVMEGFLNFRLPPWVRRLITRLLAIAPAVYTILHFGEHKTGALLVLSQVILSAQLPFAVIPLVHFVSDRAKMGEFAAGPVAKALAWVTVLIIVGLNVKLVAGAVLAIASPVVLYAVAIPLALVLSMLLAYVTFKPWTHHLGRLMRPRVGVHAPAGELGAELAKTIDRPVEKVAIALDFSGGEAEIIREALRFIGDRKPRLAIMHVNQSAGAIFLGKDAGDAESYRDQEVLDGYADELRNLGFDVVTGYGTGRPVPELKRMILEFGADLVVLGAHGHKGLQDIFLGTTADKLRHELDISVLVVAKKR